MVKIYFGCSMRGEHKAVSRDELCGIQAVIEELGHKLVTKHTTKLGILEEESKLDVSYIHDRDYKWLLEAGMGIFEITNPSLGVGGEISDMVHMKKPVLCLIKKPWKDKISAYIRGKQNSEYVNSPFECHNYSSIDDITNIIKTFVKEYVD